MEIPTHKIVLEELRHRDQDCVAIRFPYDRELTKLIKQIPNVLFSKTNKCWYVVRAEGIVDTIIKECKLHRVATESKLNLLSGATNSIPERQRRDSEDNDCLKALRLMEQKLHLKGYSAPTTKTYLSQFRWFLRFFGGISPTEISELEIRNYLLYLVEQKKVSRSTQNQAINAIKFFYEVVLRQERKVYYLERPLKERRLPEVLSQEEVVSLFSVTHNIKHRSMLMLIYSAGLRRGELLRLRLSDVDFYRKVVFVRGSKGRKDRQSILAKSLEPLLHEYIAQYKPKYWMFEGIEGGKYGERSIARVLEQAAQRAEIKKEITLHTLRHSFATHLLEAGTSTRYIQELLGHESSKTTEIYTHVSKAALSKLQSPLDQIANRNFLEKGGGE